MQNDIAIKVQNLTKIYHLYDKPQDRLKEALNPFKKSYHHDFYAMNDVSFEIKKGETVGIIGKNGAGKSTLLKMITGVLTPTRGSIEVDGKIASLLELGAGFNPEMTGIENIYLNGTLVGFTKEEMDNKLDDILEFADIGEFIHQQVKTYSSGMFARLAFSVAINIEPDILIVDETLAVGDSVFALKCMNKMNKMKEKGATMLLVTHDTQSIQIFTSMALWIEKGSLKLIGNSKIVCERYTQYIFNDENTYIQPKLKKISENNDFFSIKKNCKRWGNKEIEIIGYKLYSDDGDSKNTFEWGENINISFKVIFNKTFKINEIHNIGFGVSFRNKQGLDIITSTTLEDNIVLKKYKKNNICVINFKFKNILKPENYFLLLVVEKNNLSKISYFDFIEDLIEVKIISMKQKFYSLVRINVRKSILYEN
jgi:ABC-type polysaccharide/polyol phosphate transport system ATPase subunit